MHSLWSVQLRRRRRRLVYNLITHLSCVLSNLNSESLLMLEIFSFFIRKMWRQKSRRQRKMEIQKKQKWRLRSLPCYLFAALSYQPGQHRVVELVLSVSLREIFLFAPMLSHCTGVLKHSGPAFFFMKCYLLVFKMSFVFYLYKLGHTMRSVFHFLRFYISMLEAQSLLCQCWPDDS